MDIKHSFFFICCPAFLFSASFHKSEVLPLQNQQSSTNTTDSKTTLNCTNKNPQPPSNKHKPHLRDSSPTTKAMRWYNTDYCTICCRHIPLYSWYYHSYTCHRRTTVTTTRSSSRPRCPPPRRSHSRHRETEREYEYERETTIRHRRTTERSRSRHRPSSSSYYYYLPWRYHHRPAPTPEPVRCPTPAPLPEPSCRRRESEDRDKGWRRRRVDIYLDH